MTESDAYLISRLDQDEITRRVQKAKDPDEVLNLMRVFCSHRMKFLENGDAVLPVVTECFTKAKDGPSFSRSLHDALNLLVRTIPKLLEPEDTRAYLIYLVGSKLYGPGLFQWVLSLTRDADTDVAAESLQESVEKVRAILDRRDAETFGPKLEALSSQPRIYVTALLEEAKRATAEEFHELAREHIVQARRLVQVMTRQGRTVPTAPE